MLAMGGATSAGPSAPGARLRSCPPGCHRNAVARRAFDSRHLLEPSRRPLGGGGPGGAWPSLRPARRRAHPARVGGAGGRLRADRRARRALMRERSMSCTRYQVVDLFRVERASAASAFRGRRGAGRRLGRSDPDEADARASRRPRGCGSPDGFRRLRGRVDATLRDTRVPSFATHSRRSPGLPLPSSARLLRTSLDFCVRNCLSFALFHVRNSSAHGRAGLTGT
jgi:hypothetical protein